MTDRLATPDEVDARGVEMRAFMKMTGEQMQAAAAGRAEFSSSGSTTLLREWVKRWSGQGRRRLSLPPLSFIVRVRGFLACSELVDRSITDQLFGS
jgi:hypothetical protein